MAKEIQIEPFKTIRLSEFSITRLVMIRFKVEFVELNAERYLEINPRTIESWLKENPDKDLDDFFAEYLEPAYDNIALAQTWESTLKEWAGE